MLENELATAAERVAPPVRPDLADAVLARLDELEPRRWRRAAVAAGTALVLGLGLSPQVRAAAADLLGIAGLDVGREEPDASPTPAEPLPSQRVSDLDRVVSAVDFPINVPALLGEPDAVVVADGGRVVSMSWRGGTVVLDQFDGQVGPVFAKQVGGLDVDEIDLDGVPAWWIPGPHDLIYVDAAGSVRTATARLAGRTLLWESGTGVSYRLEGADLTRSEATRISQSLKGTS